MSAVARRSPPSAAGAIVPAALPEPGDAASMSNNRALAALLGQGAIVGSHALIPRASVHGGTAWPQARRRRRILVGRRQQAHRKIAMTSTMQQQTLTAALAVVTALAGCASQRGSAPWPPPPPPGASTTAPGSASAPAAPAPGAGPMVGPDKSTRTPAAMLAPERKYLTDRFAGTPVAIAFDDEGALVVDVPLAYAFDAGKDTPKPALLKVLDYVSTSLRRVQASRFTAAAPGDAKPAPGLADRRAKAVSQYIVTRGVNALRAAGTAAEETGGVRVRIVADRPAP
jgi:outer membrane protein OmpA-like peptidoglycan-associated protein